MNHLKLKIYKTTQMSCFSHPLLMLVTQILAKISMVQGERITSRLKYVCEVDEYQINDRKL